MDRFKFAVRIFFGFAVLAGASHVAGVGLTALVPQEQHATNGPVAQLAMLLALFGLVAVEMFAAFCAIVGPVAVLAGELPG